MMRCFGLGYKQPFTFQKKKKFKKGFKNVSSLTTLGFNFCSLKKK